MQESGIKRLIDESKIDTLQYINDLIDIELRYRGGLEELQDQIQKDIDEVKKED